MKIFILQKSIGKISCFNKKEYDTSSITVFDFIKEMITKNYIELKKMKNENKETFLSYINQLIDCKDKIRLDNNINFKLKNLEEYIEFAHQAFKDNIYYIINKTQDINYSSLDDFTNFNEKDEIVIIKLKYLRGMI